MGIQTAVKMLFPLDNSCIMCIFCQHVVFVCVFQTNENVTKLLTALQDDIANLSEDVSYIARLDLDPVYMEWGTPVWWGKFLLFCVHQSVKTKETYPTRPGSPTPCKQALNTLYRHFTEFEAR